jgi:hypothetical protein
MGLEISPNCRCGAYDIGKRAIQDTYTAKCHFIVTGIFPLYRIYRDFRLAAYYTVRLPCVVTAHMKSPD